MDTPGGIYSPTDREQEILRYTFERFDEMRKARERKYRLLGDRTPQKYWDECEKRFVSFPPPKDITEEDWQANVVMGITRNAVLSQVAKTGSRVPEARFKSYTKDGFVEDERGRIYENLYRWSLAREQADRKQQFISLGSFVRGNVCVYEGWEDCEEELDIITDTDFETGAVKSEKQTVKHWGPKRQIVPLDEMFFPNMFSNDFQSQGECIWRKIQSERETRAEFEGMAKAKYIKAGYYTIGPTNEPFFRSTSQMTGKQCEVVRHYIRKGKHKDRFRLIVSGVLMLDIPLPFNHKRLPFGWAHNEPLADQFMLGLSVPFKVLNDQDTADSIWNMALDKNLLSMQAPVMTDDPDPNIRTYLSPGGIMQFAKGSQWNMAPIAGVTASEMGMLQEALRQAKEDAGTAGGGGSMTSKGGSVTARQAVMVEEEAKRILGISMANLEGLERDLAAQRILNIIQFAPGHGKAVEAHQAPLDAGRKGRFVAYLAGSDKEAENMKPQLSVIEQIGEMLNQPTEAVALKPKWFDADDRIEAEVVPESTYLRNKSIEQATNMENITTMAGVPAWAAIINWEEALRDTLKILGKDEVKWIQKAPVPQIGPDGQPMPPGMEGMPPSPGTGPVTQDLGAGQPGLNKVMG